MKNKNLKKIKQQKNIAIIMIVSSIILIVNYSVKENIERVQQNNIIIIICLFIYMICGVVGLKNSLNKLRNLK